VSRPWEDTNWTGETGRADDVLRKYMDQWGLPQRETTAYLCCHPHMIENARGILETAGWNKDAIFQELYFQPGKGTAPGLADSAAT
jgi:ferredoxin--NADP+ reductase